MKYHRTKLPISPSRFVPLVVAVAVVVGCSLILGVGNASPNAMFASDKEASLESVKPPLASKPKTNGSIKQGNKSATAPVQSNAVKPKNANTSPAPVTPPAANAAGVLAARFAVSPSWNQDFTGMPGGAPNQSVWRYDLNPEVPGWNREAQGYTNRLENVRVEQGRGLVIEARKETYSYPGDSRVFGYTSGRIDTKNSFSFEYGKVEAVMKLPRGAGSWPAFWLLSGNNIHTSKLNPTDADWAKPRFYAKDGELDIMEHYGHLPGLIEGTMHSYIGAKEGNTKVADFADAYHTYGVELSPAGITWTVDGRAFHTEAKSSDNPDIWPFGAGNKLYIILNLAMGGSGGGAINDAMGPWRMDVQRVTYYPYIGN